ncbi:MAG: hypothetical protein AUG51_17825 [Acidobacteria bacterium 13_1_20CM_3_53_8]|nr:MAG: hypothetical protein AUG51_17825 [Acidobacteria bacterium 13_1_20CM_3_53_8]
MFVHLILVKEEYGNIQIIGSAITVSFGCPKAVNKEGIVKNVQRAFSLQTIQFNLRGIYIKPRL